MKLVYIAGPLRASNGWDVTLNIIKAKALALEVWRLGAVCICPHANTDGFGGVLPEQTWIDGDIEILTRCDAVLMADGWEQSYGACNERLAAMKHGIPVFLSLDLLKEWLDAAALPPASGVFVSNVFVSNTSASIFSPKPFVNHNDGFGHGHVRPRPDGVKARCGGPGLCPRCARELAVQALAKSKDDYARTSAEAGIHFSSNTVLAGNVWPPAWTDKAEPA